MDGEQPEVLYKPELAGKIPGAELVHAALQLGRRGSGKPFEGPQEMGLVVVIMIDVLF